MNRIETVVALEHSQIHRLLSRGDHTLWISNVPEHVRRHLSCSTGAVYLSSGSAKHILEPKKAIDTYSILRLPVVIERGIHYSEPNKPRYVHAIHRQEDYTYHVAMKVANGGHELWVCSMYKLRPSDLRAKLRKYVEIAGGRSL